MNYSSVLLPFKKGIFVQDLCRVVTQYTVVYGMSVCTVDVLPTYPLLTLSLNPKLLYSVSVHHLQTIIFFLKGSVISTSKQSSTRNWWKSLGHITDFNVCGHIIQDENKNYVIKKLTIRERYKNLRYCLPILIMMVSIIFSFN